MQKLVNVVNSPRTPATRIAATTPGLIVRILKFWF